MFISRVADKSTLIWVMIFTLLGFFLVFKYVIRIDDAPLSLTRETLPKDVVAMDASLTQSSKLIVQGSFSSASKISSSEMPQIRTAAGTPAEKEVLLRWMESRGRFSPESLKDYETYDIETLKKLVESGDLKAMKALADLYISKKYTGGDGMDKAMQLSKFAAAHGSTEALQLYSVLYATDKYEFGSRKLNSDDLMEVLAWKNTAALRGDMTWNNVAKFDIESSGVNLTDSDRSRIAQRSIEIYNELLANRKELGLGDFDNSRPVEADRFFKYLDNFMDTKK